MLNVLIAVQLSSSVAQYVLMMIVGINYLVQSRASGVLHQGDHVCTYIATKVSLQSLDNNIV